MKSNGVIFIVNQLSDKSIAAICQSIKDRAEISVLFLESLGERATLPCIQSFRPERPRIQLVTG